MTGHQLSLLCLSLYSAVVVLAGLRYMTITRYLPHHAAAAGRNWDDLSRGEQILFLTALRSAGGAFVACGIAVAFLIYFPFRNGEPWARYAILAIGCCAGAPLVHGVLAVARGTKGKPPLAALAIPWILLLAGVLAGGAPV